MKFFSFASIIFSLFIPMDVFAQDALGVRVDIAVIGKATRDSISLRWAPSLFSTWKAGNELGYHMERYTIVRNGRSLDTPEKLILTTSPLKPFPETAWEPLVRIDKYAAIAAQALFGDRFEINFQQSDVFQIANKVKENEQRFAFALFCADVSLPIAQASGLFFTDHQVRVGEKYLYRVAVYQSTDTLQGSIYVSPDEIETIPKPDGLKVTFQDESASLQWDRSRFFSFTAYSIERSTDGKNFSVISDVPLVTVSPTTKESPYEFFTDSLPDINQEYFYRIKGITPFGEHSQPSEVVSGKGVALVNENPNVIEGENINNQSILIHWVFPQESEKAISGFAIERSNNPKAGFNRLNTELLEQGTRSYNDDLPDQINYYKVIAQGLDGKQYSSSIYLIQLIDSIPPAIPIGLKAIVDESGHVQLSWIPNIDGDLYGYRIYRANYNQEELFQITTEPILNANYTDKVNLNTLNESIYYSVMAVDRNQNHSLLSEKLKLTLPDKVNPQPPVFFPIRNESSGVTLEWTPSSSPDVIRYDVYRKRTNEMEWLRIKLVDANSDSIFHFSDTTNTNGLKSNYTVVAVDRSGLESVPAQAVIGMKITNTHLPKIKWEKPVIQRDKRQIELAWHYAQQGISTYRIYRSKGQEAMILHKTISASLSKFIDTSLTVGDRYTYKIMAVSEDGRKSVLSENIVIHY